MSESPDYLDFLKRIRAGDEDAARELVRRYEPLVRREVRMRMHDRRLNRVFDSIDVTQSGFAQFFDQVTEDFELDSPEQLIRLLFAMARNRTISRVRSEHRMVRDLRRLPYLVMELIPGGSLADLLTGTPWSVRVRSASGQAGRCRSVRSRTSSHSSGSQARERTDRRQ